jgi:ubiquinone/menaquinone biosynthesis C-methylase UbiE
LFKDLVTLAGLGQGYRVLEVGCGSGQATVGFLENGLDVTGVDPGAALIGLAQSKFSAFPASRFEVAAFEEWPHRNRKFHLVAAAQSWHWVRKEIGFARAAEVLLPGG